jgi:hypothetical protein
MPEELNKELLDALLMWVAAYEDGDSGYRDYDKCLNVSVDLINRAKEDE